MTRKAENPEFFHADGTVDAGRTHKRFWQFHDVDGMLIQTKFITEATARKIARKFGYKITGFIRKP